MTKILILGVTHVDIESHQRVVKFLEKWKPEAVCLELDEYRLNILLENEKINNSEFDFDELDDTLDLVDDEIESESTDSFDNMTFDMNEFNFASILTDIGFFESQLARIIQSEQPGREMVIAYNLAKEINAEIYLIDRSLNDISKFLKEEVSQEESQRFQDMVDELMFDKKIVSKPIEKKSDNNSGNDIEKDLEAIENNDEININEVFEIFKGEESLEKILAVFSESFPKLFSILLVDRNDYMINRITEIASKHEVVAVILGYGHVKPVADGLRESNSEFEVIIENE